MRRVYVAAALGRGPMMDVNIEKYLDAVGLATRSGYLVLSWLHHPAIHRSGRGLAEEVDYLRRDFELISLAHEAWFLGVPWEDDSVGMAAEFEWCRAVGLRVRRVCLSDGGPYLAPGEPAWQARLVRNSREDILAWAARAYDAKHQGKPWRQESERAAAIERGEHHEKEEP